jgi:hypothetical protein
MLSYLPHNNTMSKLRTCLGIKGPGDKTRGNGFFQKGIVEGRAGVPEFPVPVKGVMGSLPLLGLGQVFLEEVTT